jgi:hypothetical protein
VAVLLSSKCEAVGSVPSTAKAKMKTQKSLKPDENMSHSKSFWPQKPVLIKAMIPWCVLELRRWRQEDTVWGHPGFHNKNLSPKRIKWVKQLTFFLELCSHSFPLLADVGLFSLLLLKSCKESFCPHGHQSPGQRSNACVILLHTVKGPSRDCTPASFPATLQDSDHLPLASPTERLITKLTLIFLS